METQQQTTVTGLWAGDSLPLLAALCIKSFLDHGHAFQLFTYRDYGNIPVGTRVRDAREILPEECLFRDGARRSLAPFSDWFRMEWLAREGGFWVDMDVICLQDSLPEADIWFCRESPGLLSVAALRFPAHHPVAASLASLAEDPARYAPWDTAEEKAAKDALRRREPDVRQRRRHVPWGFCGPQGFSRAAKHAGLAGLAAPMSRMCPIPWTRWRDCYNGRLSLGSPLLANAWGIHLWGEMARREPDAWQSMQRNSLAGRLLDKHLPGHAVRPRLPQKRKADILVGVCSCQAAAARRKACRDTWMRHLPPGVECRFFLGGREPLACEPDVVALWENDDYLHLPAKGLAFYAWALENYDFDWLFKCDDDTYLVPDRLKSLCDRRYDLVGDMSLAQRGFPSGGAGYLMSRRLAERIVEHGGEIPAVGAEDVLFGKLAIKLQARRHATPRLFMGCTQTPRPGNDLVSCHWCKPGLMYGIDAALHAKPLSVFHAKHPDWEDDLLFFPQGRFARANGGDGGSFSLQGDSLCLRWDSWAPETLAADAAGYASGGFRLVPQGGLLPLSALSPCRPIAGHPLSFAPAATVAAGAGNNKKTTCP